MNKEGSNLLAILTQHIISPAAQLKHKINEYEKDADYTLYEIMDDIKEILAKLGIPELLFSAYCRLYSC